jgi:anthranilate/para-aminobenzoate synthase component I
MGGGLGVFGARRDPAHGSAKAAGERCHQDLFRVDLALGAKSAADVVRAAFPAGTLSGAPKIRAMEIIEEIEPSRRGIYGGAVGYVSYTGNVDLAIAIRTLVTLGDTIHVQAGAGIVADSVPAQEHLECVNKARAVLSAVEVARRGSAGAERGR